jgi:hypothetical protein
LHAGWDETPSPVHIVQDDGDWKILKAHPQVECFHVADVESLQSQLSREAMDRALSTGTMGLAPVRDLPLAPVVGPIPVIGVDELETDDDLDDLDEDPEEEHVDTQMEIPSKFSPMPVSEPVNKDRKRRGRPKRS